MAAGPEARTGRPSRMRWSRRLRRRTRRLFLTEPTERGAVVVLGVMALTITVAHIALGWQLYPLQLIPVFLAWSWLSPRRLAWFAAWMATNFFAMVAGRAVDDGLTSARLVAVLVITALVLRGAVLRDRLGITGRTGELMLIDLRDRILRQSSLPPVPIGWTLDSELRAAGNTQFSGDFILGHRSGNGRWLDIVVVDVSGKGVAAGSRSLVLNGAMGALLTGLPGPNFLDAVNGYLVEQGWDEGFATAVHAHVDLLEGDYWITSAGHPPSVHLPADLQHWSKLQPPGVVLGLVPDVEYASVQGRLERGDSLLLYTDGMVEDRLLDIDDGTAALVRKAVQNLREPRDHPARRIMEGLARDRAGDDRAIVVLVRS